MLQPPTSLSWRQRVLVAQSDAVVRGVVRSLLNKLGREVEDAQTPDEAMDKLQRDRFDIVILNLDTADHGGLRICRALQDIPNYTDTPVVMMTAQTDHATRSQCLEAGARVFVTKPFTPAEFLRRLHPLLHLDAVQAIMFSAIIGADRGVCVQDAGVSRARQMA